MSQHNPAISRTPETNPLENVSYSHDPVASYFEQLEIERRLANPPPSNNAPALLGYDPIVGEFFPLPDPEQKL